MAAKVTAERSVEEPSEAPTQSVESNTAIFQPKDTRKTNGPLVVEASRATTSLEAATTDQAESGATTSLRLALKPMLMLSGTADVAAGVAGVASVDGAGAAAVAGEAMAVGVVGAAGGEHHD